MKYRKFLFVLLVEFSVLLALVSAGKIQSAKAGAALEAKRKIVKALTLTDLSLWSEARYVRHPSQTDFFSAFQDFPSSLEHFPAGSIVAPTTGIAAGRESERP